jgi:hypothetical protein
MSDTPRTDKEIERISSQFDGDADNSEYAMDQMGKHARQLERELAAAKAERNAVREDLDRVQRVFARIDVVRSLNSETLVRIYEASGASPQDFGTLDKFVGVMRRRLEAIEAMGYEWRWTKSIDENGEQVGAWVMRDAAEADANSLDAMLPGMDERNPHDDF